MPKTILIVEDETLLLKGLTRKFSERGFNILQAWNGEEGLDIALREHPDLILLDILLPKKDGLSFMEDLLKDEWGEKANIVILSNLEDHKGEISRVGGDKFEYLIKSQWNIDDLVEKITNSLQE